MSEIRLSPNAIRSGLALLVAVLSLGLGPLTSPVLAQDDDELDLLTDDATTEVQRDPGIWIFDVDVKQVRSITMLDGPHEGKVFWYVIYTIHNKTGEDRSTFISATATSDDKKFYADSYLPTVERAIERKYGQPLWGKTDLVKLQKSRDTSDVDYNHSPFPAGKKIDCVAILSRLDPGANKIKVHLRGLSNDLRLMETEAGDRVVQERILEIQANRPHDRYRIGLDILEVKRKTWTKKQTPLARPSSEG